VRAGDRADDVEGVLDVRDPVAQRFVERILQGLRAALDRHHGRAEQVHAVDVGRLALHVLAAHVDHALEAVRAQIVAVATPCWPAPVSAITRGLPMRRASIAWPIVLLTLCAPVWFRSSRFR